MRIIEGTQSAAGFSFAIVVSKYHDFITGRLQTGALAALAAAGVSPDDITIVRVPGAFELPIAARHAAGSGRHQAIICLGCLIRGATPHFGIASAVSHGSSTRRRDRSADLVRRAHDQLGRGGAGTSGRGHVQQRMGSASSAVEMAVVITSSPGNGPIVSRSAPREPRMNKAQRHRARVRPRCRSCDQHEIGRCEIAQAVETFFGLQWPRAEPAPGTFGPLPELAHETCASCPAIDPLIADTAEAVAAGRMAVLDRLILRMAVCELLRDRARRCQWSSTKRLSSPARSAPRMPSSSSTGCWMGSGRGWRLGPGLEVSSLKAEAEAKVKA